MDNLDTQAVDNAQTQEVVVESPLATGGEPQTDSGETVAVEPKEQLAFSWKSKLNNDLVGSPTLQKFEDTPEGLEKAIESHLNLEKLLGHEKIPVPKDENDVEGWSRFKKAMGIPETAGGYKLEDYQQPQIDGLMDNSQFAEISSKFNLTPQQANGLWKMYTEKNMEAYNGAMKAREDELNNIKNTLMQEWGDAYETNVDLGQMVINKFAADKDDNDYITATATKDPRFVRFLSKVGAQFAENKIGEFKYTRFSMTPDQAQREIDAIVSDVNHPYSNPNAPEQEHLKAVEYVNTLYSKIQQAKQG